MSHVIRALIVFAAGILAAPLALAQSGAASLKEGQASGTLTHEGKSVKLTNAYVIVDQKDSRKPVILYLTDRAVPAEKWKSDMDIMMYRSSNKFSGIGFWLDPKEKYGDFRNEVCVECNGPTSTSGIFSVKFDAPPGKAFAGTASVTSSSKMAKDFKLDGAFNAKLK